MEKNLVPRIFKAISHSFFTVFKGYGCNKISPRKKNFKFNRNWENTGKIVMRKINFILWNLRLLKFNVFSGSHKNLFVGVISNNLLHLWPLKSVKKNAICLKICWYRVFVHWKWKLFNFLMDLVLKRTYSYVAFSSHILNLP